MLFRDLIDYFVTVVRRLTSTSSTITDLKLLRFNADGSKSRHVLVNGSSLAGTKRAAWHYPVRSRTLKQDRTPPDVEAYDRESILPSIV